MSFGGSNAAIILEEAPDICRAAHGVTPGKEFKHTNGAEAINGAEYKNGSQHQNGIEHSRLVNGVEHTNGVNGVKHPDNNNILLNGAGKSHAASNGIASLDYSGSNARKRLFVLSAKSKNSLSSYLPFFEEYLTAAPESNDFAKNLSYTLGQRRTHHPHRIAVVADSIDSLKAQLAAPKVTKTKDQVLAFVFTGQEELNKPESESRINDAEISQPACTAVQLALVALLKSWEVTPTTVTGHSSGEIAAAFAAGLVSFQAAIAIAYFRGRAAVELAREHGKRGAMLALGTSFEEASALLRQNTVGYATIAAINSPQSVTVSGDVAAVENIHQFADAQGLFARRLKVDVAYHSCHLEQVAASYLASIKPFCNQEPLSSGYDDLHVRFVSSVTGREAGKDTVDASYWVKNLLQPVRFAGAIESVFSSEDEANGGQRKTPNVILEIGPHAALKNPIKQTVEGLRQRSDKRQLQFTYLPSLIRGTAGDEALLGLAGSLFTIGSSVHLGAVNQTGPHDAHVLTDLPPYAWDKSVRYIHKTRFAQGKLHPGQPYHPLLGWKSPYSEGGEQTFRQVFTLDEIPWIRDHNVAGHVVFPMTGYLSLAMEALRRVTAKVPSSFLIREFHAKRSLEIQEDERVDLTTKLRPAATGTEAFSSTAWTFEILSWSDAQGWMTHSYGQIEAETTEMTLQQGGPTLQASAPIIESEQREERSAELEYATQGQGGTRYGPAFRTMDKFWAGPGWTVMESQLRDGLDLSAFDSNSSPYYGSPISVDPPTLDGFLQGIGPLQEVDGRRPAQMPNYVSRLRISNQIPAVGGKQRFTVVTRALDYDTKAGSLRISIAAFAQHAAAAADHGGLTPVAEWESVTFRSIGSSDAADAAAGLPASYYWDAIPSLDFAEREELVKTLDIDPVDEHELPRRRKLNRAAIYYMDKVLKETAGDDLSRMPSHLASFLGWARNVVARQAEEEKDAGLESELSAEQLLAEVSVSDAQGEMLCAVGEQLASILRGEVQPLEILLKDNLLSRNYEDDKANARSSRVLARWVRHLSDVKADLRVLEIGAGTGSATLPVLEALSHGNAGEGGEESPPAFLSYTFTDISPGFFEGARAKLAKWLQRITFQKLDVSQDPVQQGFAAEDYDLVIASNVLHATPNMTATIDHVRKLLRPGGKLILLEGVRHPALTLPFALLPGWWLAEDEYRSREEGPLLTEDAWHRLLSERGFSGVDGAIADYPGTPEHMLSVMCTTRTGLWEDFEDATATAITVCGPLMDSEEEEFAQMVAEQVGERLGCPASVKPFAEIDAVDDPFCVFIDSPRSSVLSDLSPESFEALRSTLLETRGVLWVVPEGHSPEAEMIRGMLRTLRLESAAKNLFLLEGTPCEEQGAIAITKLAGRLRDPEVAGGTAQDFVWHDGKIQLPRYRPLTGAKEVFASEAGVPVRKVQNIWQDNDVTFEMTVDAAGSPDSIYFRRTNVPAQPLGDDEVLIRVEAAGVNFRDLLLVLGSIPWTTPGFEGAGVIVRTGANVTDLHVGDRVFYGALGGGSFTTHMRMESWRARRIPDHMSSVEAASISVAYSTAVMSLLRIGRLRKGERVLIHAASGAVGQACIVLAQHVGARVFATAGSPAKREFLQETFGISEDHIFSSRTPEFRDGIMCATGGKGVDVVINSLSGNLLQETWSLMADFGRFVEIGKRDLLQNSHLGMRPFDRNVTFSGVDLRAYFNQRPEELRDCLSEVADLLQRKIIVPIQPVTTLPISQIATGLRKLQSGQNIGKIVVTMGPDERVLAENPPALGGMSGSLLRPDATYLITGGTGGIGISLGAWMIDNGARNVVLLGRSGSSRPEVQRLLKQYENSDANLRAIACDVGSREELVQALDSIRDLPPVGGVIHGALYLRDALLVNATYEDWENITRPRVRGAWNLQELLPELDFFVALSSFLGSTGNVGQSIYAGTATFFDAFASHRNARGLPTVSIALPVVLDVGYVADRNLTETLKSSLGATLTEAHLRTLVKGAIIGPSSGLNRGGKAVSFTFASGNDSSALAWQCFHPVALVQRMNSKQHNPRSNGAGQSNEAHWNGLQNGTSSDPLLNLLEALISKVSSITMIERDEVEADAPLANYSLDSLVSVELRNWIRRETGVDLQLPSIVGAANLRALATYILSQTK
ncbi:putative PKS/NRPS-like protein biosynthetic cluster [Diatrype stigma]|uniref:PKS/NRPS-like protein biosynthetic cluster n=1 Tax=Diatrype stigma TaxID=117547 RepID=A0AAN9YW01_9PEZI